MKKIIALWALMLCMTGVNATTVIVMDSTQALLNEVAVVAGTDTFYTALDGRVVFKPEQLAGIDSLRLIKPYFKQQTVALDGKDPMIVRLNPIYYAGITDPEIAAYLDSIDALFDYADGAEDIVVTGYGLPASARSEKVTTSSVPIRGVPSLSKAEAARCAKASKDASLPKVESVEVLSMVEDNSATAGRLTAGEVNDFAKWYFWPTVIDSTHKEFMKDWKLSPKKRYTVQVKNQAGYPIANYPVNLTDRQGNTVFQALTDNTGKAELWENLVESQKSKVERHFIDGKPAEEWQTIIVEDPCEAAEGVDVLFVFDATGSMYDELRYLQAEMKDVIARAKDATGGLNIRTGAVVYRDHGDVYLTRISRLTEDIETTKSFIDQQSASGGGDYPEAVPEALMAAINCGGWDAYARARIAFLILDAPCHKDSATIALMHEQILNAAAQGIRIVPIVCSGIDESSELLMRCIALATNGTSFFLTDDSGIGNKHLKPTTDTLKVEHLNDMLVRTIVEFSTMPSCEVAEISEEDADEIEDFIPNPFEAQDIENHPEFPHGEGVHYLVDISGKLLGIYTGEVNTSMLPIGIYFIKSYYDGKWHTQKILIK